MSAAAKDPAATTPGPVTDEQIPAFLEALGVPGLADIHVHFLPEQVLRKVWAYFDAAAQNYGRPWPVHYRYDEQTRLDLIRGFGVRRIPALTYPHRPGMARWLNDWNREFAGRHSDVLHCATFYPEPGAAEYVAEAADAGAVLFKAHVQVGRYSPTDPHLDAVWNLLADRRIPVVLHAGSAPLPGEFTGPAPVARVLAERPDLTLVIAHMGMTEYHGFADLAEQYPGSSWTPPWPAPTSPTPSHRCRPTT